MTRWPCARRPTASWSCIVTLQLSRGGGLWHQHDRSWRAGGVAGGAQRGRRRADHRRYRRAVLQAKGWWIASQEIERREADGELGLVASELQRRYTRALDHPGPKARISGPADLRLPERPGIAAYLLAVALREAHTRELVRIRGRRLAQTRGTGRAGYRRRSGSRGGGKSRGRGAQAVGPATYRIDQGDLVPRAAAQDDGAEASQRCRKMVDQPTMQRTRRRYRRDRRAAGFAHPRCRAINAIRYMRGTAAIKAAKA